MVHGNVASAVWDRGRGLEIFETLPSLIKIKFDSGVIDNDLILDLPCTHILPFGRFKLSFDKAVQQSSYRYCFGNFVHIITKSSCIVHCSLNCTTRSDEVSEISQTQNAENESDGKAVNGSQTNYIVFKLAKLPSTIRCSKAMDSEDEGEGKHAFGFHSKPEPQFRGHTLSCWGISGYQVLRRLDI
ncbi:unnamed protein product [Camellia sinensis]